MPRECYYRPRQSAVMESLKDITNCANASGTEPAGHQQIPLNADQWANKPQEAESKLSRLYDRIRQQKENVRLQETVATPGSIGPYSDVAATVHGDTGRSHSSASSIRLPAIEECEDVMQNALLATRRSHDVLEKSGWQKERQQLE